MVSKLPKHPVRDGAGVVSHKYISLMSYDVSDAQKRLTEYTKYSM